jgi:peptidoglycan hydrolase-like protein with peptidoglycan-binding domain
MNGIMRNVLIVFLLLGMVFPSAVLAETVPAQSADSNEPNRMDTGQEASAEVSGGVLKVTAVGQEVVDLQMRLRDLGYFNYKVTGYYGTATQAAVRNFQEKNNLSPDGTVGQETLAVLYSCSAVRETISSSEATGMLPVSRGGRTSLGVMVDWFKSGRYLFPRGATAKVTDLYTGISFYMKRTGGTNHADSEPVSKSDAGKIKQIWGGWSWDRRPVILDIGGDRIAASMHGMPHAYDFVSDNGMTGHVCIHMYKSRTHIRNAEDPDHQAAVRRAAGK